MPATVRVLCALLLTASAAQIRAQLVTLPLPSGIDGEAVVAAPPGESAVIYRVGLLGLVAKAKLNQIDVVLSQLAAPLSAGLAQTDFAQLRLIESTNPIFGDGDDVLLNTVPQASIAVTGAVTSVTDEGNASMLGLLPLPVEDMFKFYFIVADMSPSATTGNSFRLEAAAQHIATSLPSTIGLPIAASNANRVVVNKLVPIIGLSPTSMGYGNVRVLSPSLLALTVTNAGATALSVTDISSDDAQFVPDIGSFAVAPGGSKVVDVTFTPTATGPQTGTLSVTHSDTLASIISPVPMSGTGVSPHIGIAPSSLAFGEVVINASEVLAVTVANTGGATLNITDISSDNGLFVPDITSFALDPGGNQVIDVTFTPIAEGANTGSLTISHDDQLTGSPSVVSMAGTGVTPGIGVSSSTLSFGDVTLGASSSQSLTVSNLGSSLLTISSITCTNSQFAADITFFSVSPGGSQVVVVTFAPMATGAQSGTLSITHNDAGSPSPVAVSGTGINPGIVLSRSDIGFGNVTLGGTKSVPLGVANISTVPVNISDISSSDPQFTPGVTSLVIAPGACDTIYTTFLPADLGSKSGILQITHDAPGGLSQVPMSGDATVDIPQVSVNFGTASEDAPSAMPVGVANPSLAPVTITSVVSDNPQFVPKETTFVIPPGGNHVLEVVFTPTGPGIHLATLAITHNPTVYMVLTGIGAGGQFHGAVKGNDPRSLVVPFGGEVLMALAICLHALFRRS